MNITYTLTPPRSFVLPHGSTRSRLLRDSGEYGIWELEARIRSGDYLSDLATQLDTIRCELKPVNSLEAEYLNQLVDELLYLQRTYELRKRSSTSRAD